MANNYYLNVSGDYTAVANWSIGAAPVAADTVQILSGDKAIETNVPAATAGLNHAGYEIGPQFTGSLGTAALPCYVGAVTAAMRFNGLRTTAAWINVDTGDASSMDVYATGAGTTALNLGGAGTWTAIRVHHGNVHIYSGPTVTALYVLGGDAVVTIDSGATITTAICVAGQVNSRAAATTIRLGGSAIWDHIGTTTYNITTLDVYGSSRFNFGSDGGTITTANLFGPDCLLDCNRGQGKSRTITSLYRFGGRINVAELGKSVTITNEYAYAGFKVEAE